MSEQRTRTVTWEDPRALAQAAEGLSGLEYLRKIVSGELPPPPIGALMNFRISELSEGHAVFTVEPAEYHYNPIGVVHGGVAATLLDSAMGCAVHSTLPAGARYTTLEIKVNYIRPMTAETGRVRCEANIIHVGGRTATAEEESWMEKGSCMHTAPRRALSFVVRSDRKANTEPGAVATGSVTQMKTHVVSFNHRSGSA